MFVLSDIVLRATIKSNMPSGILLHAALVSVVESSVLPGNTN